MFPNDTAMWVEAYLVWWEALCQGKWNSDNPGLHSHQDVGCGQMSNIKHHDIYNMKTEVELEKEKDKKEILPTWKIIIYPLFNIGKCCSYVSKWKFITAKY